MTHSEVQDRLSAYLEGDLSAAERQALEQHVVECRTCAETLGELRETLRLLHALPEPSAPAGLAERVIERVSQARPAARRPGAVRLALPLAAGLAGLAVLATFDWGEGIGVPTTPSRPGVARGPDVLDPAGARAGRSSIFSAETPDAPDAGGTGLVGAADRDLPAQAASPEAELERLLSDPEHFLDRLEALNAAERDRVIARITRLAADSGRADAVASALRATARPLGASVAQRITAPAH